MTWQLANIKASQFISVVIAHKRDNNTLIDQSHASNLIFF
jgi:hypothetical protein